MTLCTPEMRKSEKVTRMKSCISEDMCSKKRVNRHTICHLPICVTVGWLWHYKLWCPHQYNWHSSNPPLMTSSEKCWILGVSSSWVTNCGWLVFTHGEVFDRRHCLALHFTVSKYTGCLCRLRNDSETNGDGKNRNACNFLRVCQRLYKVYWCCELNVCAYPLAAPPQNHHTVMPMSFQAHYTQT